MEKKTRIKFCKGNPDECGQGMIAAFDEGKSIVVTVQAAMGEEKIVGFKEVAV
jgi:hypothetical protein